MTTAVRRGLVLGLVHVVMVASLGAALTIDRARYPRVWVRSAPVDPNLPVRGRYVSLQIELADGPGLDLPAPPPPSSSDGPAARGTAASRPVSLLVENDQLVAVPAPAGSLLYAREIRRGADRALTLVRPVAFFIPAEAEDPSNRPAGEELWVEVTVPPRGMPRPIRLGIRRGGVIEPLP